MQKWVQPEWRIISVVPSKKGAKISWSSATSDQSRSINVVAKTLNGIIKDRIWYVCQAKVRLTAFSFDIEDACYKVDLNHLQCSFHSHAIPTDISITRIQDFLSSLNAGNCIWMMLEFKVRSKIAPIYMNINCSVHVNPIYPKCLVYKFPTWLLFFQE